MISILELVTSLELGMIYGIVACGIYLTLRVLNIADLTCDGSFMMGAAACVGSIILGYSPVIALFFGSLSGGMAGACTSTLIRYARIDKLFAGILTSFMSYSISLRLMGGLPNIPLETESGILTSNYTFMILVCLCSIIFGLLSYLLKTNFGLALRCLGQNKKLATSHGINPTLFTTIGLILSNALIGLAGGLFCQYQSFADISQGVGTIILGIAAIIIGETLWPTRSITQALSMCIIGSILYRITIAYAYVVVFLD